MPTYSIEKVQIPHSDRHLKFKNQTENFKFFFISFLFAPGAPEPIDYKKSTGSAARAVYAWNEYQGMLRCTQVNLGSSTTLVEGV